MKKAIRTDGKFFDRRVKELLKQGAELPLLGLAIERLEAGAPLSWGAFNDHALRGKLAGLRSAVVGEMPDGENIVMLYRSFPESVMIVRIDAHDKAYDEERARRRS